MMKTKFPFVIAALLVTASLAHAQPVSGIGYWSKNVTAPTFNGTATFNGQIQASDGTAGAPGISWLSQPSTGWKFRASSVDFVVLGTVYGVQFSGGIVLRNDGCLLWSSGDPSALSGDTGLCRGTANRVDLPSGDSLNIPSGNITVSGDISGSTLSIGTVAPGNGLYFATLGVSRIAPTVTSAGTSPSVVTNGTASFRVNVGTGGTATTIVMAMPTATTGWNCNAENITAHAANRANQDVVQQASTTTSVTVQNQTPSTGAAVAFTASDIVRFLCVAY